MSRDFPKAGWKLEGEHRPGCLAEHDKDGLTFVVPDRDRPTTWGLKRNGHRGGSTMWHRFRCDDTRCKAVMLVRWDVLAEFVNNPPESA